MSVHNRWAEVRRLIHIVAGDLPHGQEDMETSVRTLVLEVLGEAEAIVRHYFPGNESILEEFRALRGSLAEKPTFPPPTPRSTEEEKPQ